MSNLQSEIKPTEDRYIEEFYFQKVQRTISLKSTLFLDYKDRKLRKKKVVSMRGFALCIRNWFRIPRLNWFLCVQQKFLHVPSGVLYVLVVFQLNLLPFKPIDVYLRLSVRQVGTRDPRVEESTGRCMSPILQGIKGFLPSFFLYFQTGTFPFLSHKPEGVFSFQCVYGFSVFIVWFC